MVSIVEQHASARPHDAADDVGEQPGIVCLTKHAVAEQRSIAADDDPALPERAQPDDAGIRIAISRKLEREALIRYAQPPDAAGLVRHAANDAHAVQQRVRRARHRVLHHRAQLRWDRRRIRVRGCIHVWWCRVGVLLRSRRLVELEPGQRREVELRQISKRPVRCVRERCEHQQRVAGAQPAVQCWQLRRLDSTRHRERHDKQIAARSVAEASIGLAPGEDLIAAASQPLGRGVLAIAFALDRGGPGRGRQFGTARTADEHGIEQRECADGQQQRGQALLHAARSGAAPSSRSNVLPSATLASISGGAGGTAE